MTQQEMEVLAQEIRERFPALKINTRINTYANKETRTFEEYGTIGVWYDNECVCVLHSRLAFDALVAVAHIIVDSDNAQKAADAEYDEWQMNH